MARLPVCKRYPCDSPQAVNNRRFFYTALKQHAVSDSLLININNSFTKAVIWNGKSFKPLGRIPTPNFKTTHIQQWLKKPQLEQAVICSVVPAASEKVPKKTRIPCHFTNHKSPWGIKINFPKPSSIGADRLANAAAVHAFYSEPAVVIDYGTAVTFDIISAEGEYLGGVITPGMRVFRDYLAERTALLPKIKIYKPETVVGKSTQDAMRSGAYYGYLGLVREILREIQLELNAKRLAIIATGGDSNLFENTESLFDVHDPDLSFKGMSVVADHLSASHQ